MGIKLSVWERSLVRCVAALIAVTAIVVAPTRAARTFDLSTASIADINAAFDAGALTSERLTRLYLARIAAYDKAGPTLNSVLRLNPRALEDARALDAERRVSGREDTTSRHTGAAQSQHRRGGLASDSWVLRSPRFARHGRCRADRAPAACGLRDSRAHQHERVRERPGDFDARRADSQSLRARPLAGRLERRKRSGDRCWVCGFRVGNRHWRINPGTRVRQRNRWSSTHLWADGPWRDHPTGVIVGYRRPHGRPCRGLGSRPERDGRIRFARPRRYHASSQWITPLLLMAQH